MQPQPSQSLLCIFAATDRLLELTNKTPEPRVVHMSLTEHFRYLKRLLDDPNFSEIMLPCQAAMTVTLPAQSDINGGFTLSSSSSSLNFTIDLTFFNHLKLRTL